MIRCLKCGHQNLPSYPACGKCGASLAGAADAMAHDEQRRLMQERVTKARKGRTVYMGFGLVALVSELSRPIVLSDRALRQLARIKQAERRCGQRSGRQPGMDVLARESGVPRQQIDSLTAADRTAIVEILRDTKPDLRAAWAEFETSKP
mgnify:CR=1 FL=1